MPDVPANIHAIVAYDQPFRAQSGALFFACRGIRGETESAIGSDYAVPGQACVFRQLRQDTTDPAGRPTESGQFGEVSVADHLAGWHLGQCLIQGLPAPASVFRCGLMEGAVRDLGMHRIGKAAPGLRPEPVVYRRRPPSRSMTRPVK